MRRMYASLRERKKKKLGGAKGLKGGLGCRGFRGDADQVEQFSVMR